MFWRLPFHVQHRGAQRGDGGLLLTFRHVHLRVDDNSITRHAPREHTRCARAHTERVVRERHQIRQSRAAKHEMCAITVPLCANR